MRSREHARVVGPSARPDKGVGLHYTALALPSDGTTGTSSENRAEIPRREAEVRTLG